MATIKRQSPLQSIINFGDFDIRIFIKYKKGVVRKIANEIRFWKLPPNSSFLYMLNTKNLIWAIYNQDANYLHGWFSKDGDFSEAITEKIANCTNFEELKNLLVDFQKIIHGEIVL